MTFNELVLKDIIPYLNDKGFAIAKEYKNYIRLQSPSMTVTLSHNAYESSNSLQMGLIDERADLIEDDVVKFIFNSDIKITNTTQEFYAKNVLAFFKENEVEIFDNTTHIFEKIRFYIDQKTKRYNWDLLLKQYTIESDEAWGNKEYKKFIDVVDNIGKSYFPESYTLKYDIASKKLAQQKIKNWAKGMGRAAVGVIFCGSLVFSIPNWHLYEFEPVWPLMVELCISTISLIMLIWLVKGEITGFHNFFNKAFALLLLLIATLIAFTFLVSSHPMPLGAALFYSGIYLCFFFWASYVFAPKN